MNARNKIKTKWPLQFLNNNFFYFENEIIFAIFKIFRIKKQEKMYYYIIGRVYLGDLYM